MTPGRRKRREWLLIVVTILVCLLVSTWRMALLSEPDLTMFGKVAGLLGNDRNGHPAAIKQPVNYRHLEVRSRCGNLTATEDPSTSELRFPYPPYIYFEPKTFFCPVPKAGSTFLTRYFLTVRHSQNDPNLSPLSFSIESASRVRQLPFTIFKDPEERNQFLKESTKVVFTRHPFRRLYSAYIDKLFAPNPYYWKYWGMKAVQYFKTINATQHPCGSFISFEAFIKLVIKGIWKRDVHIMPVSLLCRFCQVDYDVIGKLESIMADVDSLSSKLNVSGAFIHDEHFKDYFTEDAVKDSTKDPLTTWRGTLSTCISDFNVGRLIWRKLQIRGFIDASFAFPFTAEEMEGISLDHFRQACFFAVEKSVDKDKLKRQKQVAYEEAFSLIPDKQMVQLQKIYEHDFFLLDYNDKRPSGYVPGRRSDSIGSLDWKKTWDV